MDDLRRIDVGGHTLRVEISGRGDHQFLCLHGLVDSLEIWDALTAPLGERGQVVRIDQRGHGESEAPPGPYTRNDLAADVIAVLDALGIKTTMLVGHSMGGIVAMTTALAFPDRITGLVLCGTASECNEKAAQWYERIAAAGERDGNEGLTRAVYGKSAKRRIMGNPQGIAHVTRTLKSLYDDPLTPRLAQMHCRALLMVGQNDPMGARASERIHTAFPQGTAALEVVPDEGHWIHVTAPDGVITALDRWLAHTS